MNEITTISESLPANFNVFRAAEFFAANDDKIQNSILLKRLQSPHNRTVYKRQQVKQQYNPQGPVQAAIFPLPVFMITPNMIALWPYMYTIPIGKNFEGLILY